MKQYFTKYLPVEGELKKGKYFKDTTGTIRIADETDEMMENFLTKRLPPQQVYKLFLCSRDIQVGDEMTRLDGSKFKADKAPDGSAHWNGHAYKVIGEISPEATWVKEGREFDEDEVEKRVKFTENNMTYPFPLNWEEKLRKDFPEREIVYLYLIKCSCCGTFK
jgi:hypothetical protein